MTTPIRIPNVAVFDAGNGATYRQITSYAEVTPEIQAQILAPLMARVEALERHYHHLKPGQTALPVTDEGPVAPAPVDATPDPHRFIRDESAEDACQICGYGSGHRDHGDKPHGDESANQMAIAAYPDLKNYPAQTINAEIAAMHRILTAVAEGDIAGLYDAAAVKAEQQAMYAAGVRDGKACMHADVDRIRKAHEDRRDEIGKKESRISTLTAQVKDLEGKLADAKLDAERAKARANREHVPTMAGNRLIFEALQIVKRWGFLCHGEVESWQKRADEHLTRKARIAVEGEQ